MMAREVLHTHTNIHRNKEDLATRENLKGSKERMHNSTCDCRMETMRRARAAAKLAAKAQMRTGKASKEKLSAGTSVRSARAGAPNHTGEEGASQ